MLMMFWNRIFHLRIWKKKGWFVIITLKFQQIIQRLKIYTIQYKLMDRIKDFFLMIIIIRHEKQQQRQQQQQQQQQRPTDPCNYYKKKKEQQPHHQAGAARQKRHR